MTLIGVITRDGYWYSNLGGGNELSRRSLGAVERIDDEGLALIERRDLVGTI